MLSTRIKQEILEVKTILFGKPEEKYTLIATLCSVIGGEPMAYTINRHVQQAFYELFMNKKPTTREMLGFYKWHISHPTDRRITVFPDIYVKIKWTEYFIYQNS